MGSSEMGGGLKVSFGAFLKNRFVDFCNFTTLIRILAPSFRTLPSKLSMPAALDGFKPVRIFNIFQMF